jgi:hypothetical protein
MKHQEYWSKGIFTLCFAIRGGIGGGGESDDNVSELVDKWSIFIEFDISDDLIGTCWATICPWSLLAKSGWKVIIRLVVFV